ncbi:MAG: hypothetical protein ACQCN5_05090 [Candidatus Bathyarchaeia archaeon]
MSVNQRRLIRKCLLILAVLTSVTVELAILLTFLSMYRIIAIELYWAGLIILLAAFLVSIHILQTVAEVKCERYDNQLKPPQPNDPKKP